MNQINNKNQKVYKIIPIKRNIKNCSDINYKTELERLNMERDEFLSSGIYTETDPLIMQLDIRIRKLIELA